jgi:hypothetical protein
MTDHVVGSTPGQGSTPSTCMGYVLICYTHDPVCVNTICILSVYNGPEIPIAILQVTDTTNKTVTVCCVPVLSVYM